MLSLLPLLAALAGASSSSPPCDALSQADAQAYLGEPVVHVLPEAPGPDEETGSVHSSCTYAGKGRALVVTVDEFGSADAAQKAMTAAYVGSRAADEDTGEAAEVEPEPGLGDRAFYATSPVAGMVVMLKGPKAYGAILGGAAPKPGDRAALRKLVTALAAKG